MRVYAFHCGGDQADLAVNDPFDENVGTKQYSPYFFYLVDHPRGRVLFDTGLHPEIRTDFAGRMGSAAGAFPIEMHEDVRHAGGLQRADRFFIRKRSQLLKVCEIARWCEAAIAIQQRFEMER